MRRHLAAALLFLILAGNAPADKRVLVAGGGEETGSGVLATKAKLGAPFGTAFDPAGDMILVEYGAHRVGKVDAKGTLTILAGSGQKGDTGDDGPPLQA